MKGPIEVWSVQLLRKNLQAHLTARENAERQRRTYLPQNVAVKNKFTTTPKRPSAEELIAGTGSNASYLQNQQSSRKKCAYCQGNHWSDECRKYETIMQRKEKIKGKCYICFSPKHLLRACPSDRECVYCKRRHNHHRSLCPEKFRDHDNEAGVVITEERPVTSINGTSMQSHGNEAKTTLDETTKESVNGQAHSEDACLASGANVLLQTATIDIKNPQSNQTVTARILLEPGSHRPYITQKLANKLELKWLQKEIISVVTFGSTKPKQIESHVVEIELPLKDGTSFKLTANVIPEITGFIHRSPVRLGKTAFLWKDLPLADSIPSEKEISAVEILISSDYYLELITYEKNELEPGLYLLGSKLGWILSGRFGKRACNESNASMLIFSCLNQTTLVPVLLSESSLALSDQNIDDFWHMENISIKDPLIDADDNKALQHFNDTVTFKDNRYHVTWRNDVTNELPENFELAMGPLLKRMKQTPELLTKYNETIQDQLEKGIIEKVDTNLQNSEKAPRKH